MNDLYLCLGSEYVLLGCTSHEACKNVRASTVLSGAELRQFEIQPHDIICIDR